jgi:hypothetical protein
VKSSQIPDGASSTYLLGEKFLSPDLYEDTEKQSSGFGTRRALGDNQGAWVGFEWDNHRVAWNPQSSVDPLSYQPRQDVNGVDDPNIYAFGSAHPASLNMAMTDGSVQSISYDIDRDTHRFLASRLDGEVGKLDE